MSQFWIYLKTNIRADLKQVHIIIGTFLLLPLFFSFIMGMSFSSAFTPEVSIDPLQVNLQNEDEGPAGEALEKTFIAEEMEEYIEIVEEEDADFNIHIHSDYTENFEETPLTIETKENSSTSDERMLTQLLTEWQQAIVDQETLLSEMEDLQDPQVTENLVAGLEEIAAIDIASIFQTETYDSDTALTSNQFSAVTGLMYLLFMSWASSVTMSTNDDFKGTRKRLGILPLTPKNKVLYEIGTNTIIYSVLAVLYVVIWRLIDANTFVGNPIFYIFWIIIYTLFFQVANTILLHVIPDKLTNLVYQGGFMLYMVFGFLPLDRMIGGDLGEFFNQNFIRQIFNQPFYDYMITQDISGNLILAGSLIFISVALILITIRLKERKELSIA
jgi:hypothetical protein